MHTPPPYLGCERKHILMHLRVGFVCRRTIHLRFAEMHNAQVCQRCCSSVCAQSASSRLTERTVHQMLVNIDTESECEYAYALRLHIDFGHRRTDTQRHRPGKIATKTNRCVVCIGAKVLRECVIIKCTNCLCNC